MYNYLGIALTAIRELESRVNEAMDQFLEHQANSSFPPADSRPIDRIFPAVARPACVESPEFDLNFLLVPSSQPTSAPPDFFPMSPGDSLDEHMVHPSVRATSPRERILQRHRVAAQHGPSSSAAIPNGGNGNEGNPNSKTRKQWERWQVEILLELKKRESEEDGSYASHEQMETNAGRWGYIAAELAKHGIARPWEQVKKKYERVTAAHKKINDYHGRSGVAPYEQLDARQRKKENLDPDFHQSYISILSTFYKKRPCMNPPYQAESLPRSKPNNNDNPDSPTAPGNPSSPLQSDPEHTCPEPLRDIGERSNSGKRRKKDSSRSSLVMVDAIEKFGQSISSTEEKRDNRESEHFKFLEENMVASRKQDEKQHQEMVDVFKTIAQAFLIMAQR
ncbi:hypothetical protein R1flu_016674 [Riccia fluitans]|uniref:Myb-like domain-containing protein n=1 Tax=Riccia fluitans TaxID=41844 RepID=A0ABD1YN23_9MARC